MNNSEILGLFDDIKQFKEIWIAGSNGQSICALINGDIGWLMYLRFEGDTGLSSRNPMEISQGDVKFQLDNGQMDTYPKNWTCSVDILKEAIQSFLENGELPSQVEWHDDAL